MKKELVEKQYTLWERIKSDVPGDFRKAQYFGLGLVALGASLAEVPGIPEKLTTALMSVGATIAAVAQFAVKQCEPIK